SPRRRRRDHDRQLREAGWAVGNGHDQIERCDACRFWVPQPTAAGDGPDARVGSCRRNPPPDPPKSGSEVSDWPRTARDQWCGEWKAKRREPGLLPDWPSFLGRLSIRTRNALLSSGKGYWPIEGWAELLAADGQHLLDRRNFRYGSLVEVIEQV